MVTCLASHTPLKFFSLVMNLPYQVETFVTASTANQGHHVLGKFVSIKPIVRR